MVASHVQDSICPCYLFISQVLVFYYWFMCYCAWSTAGIHDTWGVQSFWKRAQVETKPRIQESVSALPCLWVFTLVCFYFIYLLLSIYLWLVCWSVCWFQNAEFSLRGNLCGKKESLAIVLVRSGNLLRNYSTYFISLSMYFFAWGFWKPSCQLFVERHKIELRECAF